MSILDDIIDSQLVFNLDGEVADKNERQVGALIRSLLCLSEREAMTMKILVMGGAMLLSAAALTNSANARESYVDVTPGTKTCFVSTYVPALYRVNTRGRLVASESYSWRGSWDSGRVEYVRSPAVWVESRTLVEADHYSLRPTACR